jgi:hypothetical protein
MAAFSLPIANLSVRQWAYSNHRFTCTPAPTQTLSYTAIVVQSALMLDRASASASRATASKTRNTDGDILQNLNAPETQWLATPHPTNTPPPLENPRERLHFVNFAPDQAPLDAPTPTPPPSYAYT